MDYKIYASVAIVVMFVAYTSARSAPLNSIPQFGKGSESGSNTVTITHLSDLSKMMNETVPLMLRSSSDPQKFVNNAKRNHTLDEQSRTLLSLIGRPLNHVKRRSASWEPCPITWVLEFQAARYPSHIWKAMCNGVGTTCIAPGSTLPGCREISVTYQVLHFRGITPNGSQVWQWDKKKIPVSCSC